MFQNTFHDKRVLVTGHTGFKGSWLTRWLLNLGAQVSGLALSPETEPNLFTLLDLDKEIEHHLVDVRDQGALHRVIQDTRPEIVFHLAAQALVRSSYLDPKETWDINVGGTVNLLEALRQVGGVRVCLVVTSDKCYENKEQDWGYRESDPMGGHDPYSSSKGAVELAVASWRRSFFQDPDGLRLATARAGNVIGGGDWATDRLVVDFVKSIGAAGALELRNPGATRPWQHVLEPLSGYLDLGARLYQEDGWKLTQAWNLGPGDECVVDVETLARALVSEWGMGEVHINQEPNQPHEAGLLQLDCSRARTVLGWHSVWGFQETVHQTVDWYRGYQRGEDAKRLTRNQLETYATAAIRARLPWAL